MKKPRIVVFSILLLLIVAALFAWRRQTSLPSAASANPDLIMVAGRDPNVARKPLPNYLSGIPVISGLLGAGQNYFKEGIWLLDPSTGEKADVLPLSTRYIVSAAALSPSKTDILFISQFGLELLNIETGKKKLLAENASDALWLDDRHIIYKEAGPETALHLLDIDENKSKLLFSNGDRITVFKLYADAGLLLVTHEPRSNYKKSGIYVSPTTTALFLQGGKVSKSVDMFSPADAESISAFHYMINKDRRYCAASTSKGTRGTGIWRFQDAQMQSPPIRIIPNLIPVAWNPDEDILLLKDLERAVIYTYTLGDDAPRLIASFPPAGEYKEFRELNWAAGGKYIVYACRKSITGAPQEVIVTDTSGQTIRRFDMGQIELIDLE